MSHVSDDVINRNFEIKEKGWKKESHTFGLRKEGRKFPPFDPYDQCSKKEERNTKRKEKMGRNEREKGSEMRRRNEEIRKGKERKAKRRNKTKPRENVGRKKRGCRRFCLHIFRERVSSFSLDLQANPTVGFLRTKKLSCSTRREFRVDSGFEEFQQTP